MISYPQVDLWLPPPDDVFRRWLAPPIPVAAPLAFRDDPDALVLDVPLRDFRKKDVVVEARPGVLEIRAERRRGLWTEERRSFVTRVALPANADASAIDAAFSRGVLSVRIGKLPHARRRSIPVRVNGALPAAKTSETPTSPLERARAAARAFGARVRDLVA